MSFGLTRVFRLSDTFRNFANDVSAKAKLIRALFGNDEQGGLWLPGPDTCWTDVNRTTPAGVGDTVAFMDDLKDGLRLGSEILSATSGYQTVPSEIVTSKATDFPVTVDNGTIYAEIVNESNARRLEVNFTAVAGKTYECRYDIETNSGFTSAVSVDISNLPSSTSVGGRQTYTAAATATGTAAKFRLYVRTSSGTQEVGDYIRIHSFSVRELKGNHATQATADARPALGRTVEGGRRNLLTHTEGFDNAPWNEENVTVSADTIIAPDGTSTTHKLVDDEVDSFHRVTASNLPAVEGTLYTITCYVKRGERDFVGLQFGGTYGSAVQYFDIANKLIGPTAGGNAANLTSAQIEEKDNGWLRISVSVPSFSTDDDEGMVSIRNAISGTETAYSGNGSDGTYIWGAQLEAADTASDYQRVGASALDVTEAGKKELWYLSFDGVDDLLATADATHTLNPDSTAMLATAVYVGSETGALAPSMHAIGNGASSSFQWLFGMRYARPQLTYWDGSESRSFTAGGAYQLAESKQWAAVWQVEYSGTEIRSDGLLAKSADGSDASTSAAVAAAAPSGLALTQGSARAILFGARSTADSWTPQYFFGGLMRWNGAKVDPQAAYAFMASRAGVTL